MDQRREERLRGRNGEDARGTWRRYRDPFAESSWGADITSRFPSWRARPPRSPSGVPTCIQMPSRRRPCSRPASAARSNMRLSEKFPCGASANSAGAEHRGAGIDERHDLALGAPPQPPVRAHGEIAAALIADARGRGASSSRMSMLSGSNASASRAGWASRRRSRACRNSWKNGSSPSCRSAFTTPPPVSSTRSRSSEISIFGRAAFQMLFDLVRHVVHVDDGGLDAGVGEPVEHVVDQRLAGDLDQRLRQRVGERAHARPRPGGKHHARCGGIA